jgi:hypothetical protein
LLGASEQAPTGLVIGTDPQWTADWHQAIHQARQALAPEVAMNQAAWLNVAICAAQRAKIAIQEAKSLKLEDPRRRLLFNREIDEFNTVNMAFNRAAGTRVLLDSVTFRWMFDYSELDQSVVEQEWPLHDRRRMNAKKSSWGAVHQAILRRRAVIAKVKKRRRHLEEYSIADHFMDIAAEELPKELFHQLLENAKQRHGQFQLELAEMSDNCPGVD